jgi:nitroreductase
MDVYECLRSRRTVREFKPDPVSDESLGKILSAARWAPSSRNQQPWRLVVVRDRETLARIGETAQTGSFIGMAPLAIALVMENADQPGMDGGRALQQMEIMAWAEGMGTCFVTLTDDERRQVMEILNIPESMDLVTVLPFGYRADSFRGRGAPRIPMSDMVHVEKFGNPYGG